jgi:hypothetical protein
LNGELEQEARLGLLHYYSEKCTSHATNILTITLGLFAYAQAYNFIIPSLDWLGPFVHATIISGFLTGGLYQAARLVLWSKYITKIITTELAPSEIGRNLVHEFHRDCYGKLRNTLLYRIAAQHNAKVFVAVWLILSIMIFLFGYQFWG